jgi:hypothetical protein
LSIKKTNQEMILSTLKPTVVISIIISCTMSASVMPVAAFAPSKSPSTFVRTVSTSLSARRSTNPVLEPSVDSALKIKKLTKSSKLKAVEIEPLSFIDGLDDPSRRHIFRRRPRQIADIDREKKAMRRQQLQDKYAEGVACGKRALQDIADEYGLGDVTL